MAYWSSISGSCPAWFEGAQGAREICTGGLTADPCSYVCCELPTLSNETFRKNAGDLAWQAWLEKKIRDGVGSLVLDRLAADRRFSTDAPLYDFQKIAWNQGVRTVDSWKQLGDRLKIAVDNFNALFPGSRWQNTAVFHKEITEYRLSLKSWQCGWKYRSSPNPAPRNEAFMRALLELGLTESGFEEWSKTTASELFRTVPTSEPAARIGTVPTVPSDLLSWSADGSIVVGDWLSKFLAAFQGKRGKLIAAFRPSVAKAVIEQAQKQKQAAAQTKQEAAARAAEAAQEESRKKAESQRAALGIGTGIAVVAAAGAAYWYATRK